MDIWDTRKKSLEALDKVFAEQRNYLDAILETIDQCIEICETNEGSEYLKAIGITTLKAKNLGLCIYSLILDGHGQEAGACGRPFLEYMELLCYFRENPERINEALSDKLPSAGKRAQLIKSAFKGYRSYLNENASHSSYSDHSMSHLFSGDYKLKLKQPYSESTLRKNIRDLYVQLWLLACEAVNAIQSYKCGLADGQAFALEVHRKQAEVIFKLNDVPRRT